MPAPNEIECDLDPNLCDSSKSSNPPKSTSNNSSLQWIGECNSKNQNEGEGRFFCYIEATNSKCCEAESSRYTKYCLNYSICEDQENAPKVAPSIENSTLSDDLPKGFKRNGRDFTQLIDKFE